MACIQEGLLVFAPNRDVSGENPPTTHAYVVTVEEILRLRLVARLVVLSCGFGPHERDFVDDGHLLANSFLVAGARNVLATRWQVDDRATRLFMDAFYGALLEEVFTTDGCGTLVVSAPHFLKNIAFYDISTGMYRSEGPTIAERAHDGCISCCHFSGDGRSSLPRRPLSCQPLE